MSLSRVIDTELEGSCDSASPSLDSIVFALRNAPDWDELAADYSAGRAIPTDSYVPSIIVPGFPSNIADCIAAWNAIFRISYFQMRASLTIIAKGTRERNSNASTISAESLRDFLGRAPEEQQIAVFFTDDDDWFAPDLLNQLHALDWSSDKIKVFPLIRFESDTFTFARTGQPCSESVGPRKDFGFRFQTNNYGIPARPPFVQCVDELRDHVWGSAAADRMSIADEYHDIMISATNKTPCSASVMPGLLADPEAFRAMIHRYIASIRNCHLPARAQWCAPCLEESASLFEAALG
jgi:hypothetical protein